MNTKQLVAHPLDLDTAFQLEMHKHELQLAQLRAENAAMQRLATMQQQAYGEVQRVQHSAHLDASDLRDAMSRLQAGESLEVERFEGFTVHHRQHANPNEFVQLLKLIVFGLIVGWLVYTLAPLWA